MPILFSKSYLNLYFNYLGSDIMKHAYLIMAHNNFYVLETLLKLLDDERNDIYIHIDKKVKNFDFDKYKKLIKKSNITFINRINVKWGSSKQIECELALLKEAIKTKHKYYHLLSGVDLPLKSQDEIHNFFKNTNKEFIKFRNHKCFKNKGQFSNYKIGKVDYYHLFIKGNINDRNNTNKLRNFILKIQEKLKIHRVKDKDYFREGDNWFSITHELATYVVSKEKEILKKYKYTFCADEIFLHTLVYHSKFYNSLYNYELSFNAIKRLIDWERGKPYTFTENDFDELISSDRLFARKFDDNNVIVDMLYNYIKGN